MRNCWTATSYAEYHRNGCTHAAYSPGCRPLGSHSRLATTPSTMPRRLHRYKTLPARDPSGPPGTKLSQHARNTPFRRILRQQGELCTASTTTKPSRANFLPHTEPPTVQNSPDTRPRRAIPVQNSPSTPENADFGPFCASRENFVPLPPPPSRAGRIFYRKRNHLRYKTLPARSPGGRYRYKTLPTRAPGGPNRYKTLPARPKTPILAHFPHAGRVLYRVRHHQTKQGEKSHARAAPREAGQALTAPGTP